MKLMHMALFASDMERSKQFYMRYFGARPSELFHEADSDFTCCMLYFDGDVFLELMHRSDVPDKYSTQEQIGWSHVAILVYSKEQVDSLTQTLKQDGFEVFFGPRPMGTDYESCVADPDGNRVEIVYRPEAE